MGLKAIYGKFKTKYSRSRGGVPNQGILRANR